MQKKRLDQTTIDQIRELRTDGESVEEIASIMGVSCSTVSHYSSDIGKARRSYITPEIEKQIKELRASGYSGREIKEALSLPSLSHIYFIINGRQNKYKLLARDVPSPWVLNHPFENELREADIAFHKRDTGIAKRYREVVENRMKKCPNAGYDYLACHS